MSETAAASRPVSDADELPPHDSDAEAGALACVLCGINGEAERFLDQLDVAYFYDLRHQTTLRALITLRAEGKGLDVVCLVQLLKDKGWLDDAGGLAYVAELPDRTPSPREWPSWLDAVRDRATRRVVLRDAVELASLARDVALSPSTLANAARRMCEGYARNGVGKGLTLRQPDDLLAMTFDERDCVLGDWLIAKGQSFVMAGAGGLGKSRLLLQLSVATITGRQFVGLETRAPDLRWMVLQAENSNRRLRGDLAGLRDWAGAKVWPRVNAQLFIHALETDSDGLLSVDSAQTQNRIADSIAECQPDVIAWDSLYNFGAGDLNRDEDMAATLLTISRLSKAGDPQRAIVLLHHALTGRAGALRATGFDRASFGRNSKVLHSWARGQLNVAPGSADANDYLVMSCGKCSNGKEFAPFAVRLNPETMLYEVAPDFDLTAWQGEVAGRRQGPSVTVELIRSVCRPGMTKGELVKAVQNETGCGKSHAYEVIDRAVTAKKIRRDSDSKYCPRQ